MILAPSVALYFIFNGDSVAMGRRHSKKGVKSGEGAGGILRSFGSFLEILSEMVEKGETEIRREGEVELGQRKGMKAVYGFSVRLGSEGQPRVEPFGNVRRKKGKGPVVEAVREPIVDIFDEKEAVVVVAELPGINEKDVIVELRDDILTIAAETGAQKYYKEVLLNLPVTPEGLTRSYRNGILEIRICKKKG
jgi:HSP20 family protein